jgi:hypothetical protein
MSITNQKNAFRLEFRQSTQHCSLATANTQNLASREQEDHVPAFCRCLPKGKENR